MQTCHGIHDESPSEIEETASSLPEDVSSQLNAAYVSDPVQENNATIRNIDIASHVFDGFDDNDAYNEPADPIGDDDGPDKSALESFENLLYFVQTPFILKNFCKKRKFKFSSCSF